MSQKLIQDHLRLANYRKRLKEVRSQLDQAMQSDPDQQPEITVALNRLDIVLKRVRRQLRGADANFLTPDSLGEVGTSFAQVHAAIDNPASMDASAILTATDDVIEAYKALAHIPASPSQEAEAAAEYASQVETLVAAVETKVQQQLEAIDETNAALGETSTRMNTLDARIDAQAARIDGAVTNGVAKMTEVASEAKENAAAAEVKRKSEWKAALEEMVVESEKIAEDLNENNVNAFAGWSERADKTQYEIAELRERASRIVELISDSGQAGHYKSVADKNQFRATAFTILALLLYGVPVAVAGVTTWATFGTKEHTLQWTTVSIRLALGIAALVPAAYAASEAKRHKRIEDAARQRELEFAVLSSYLEELDPEQQNQIRTDLAKEYFGKPLISDSTVKAKADANAVTTKDLVEIVKTAVAVTGR